MSAYKIFKYPFLIKEQHLDIFNHVNNAKYLEILEEARWDFLNKQGLGLNVIQETRIGPVVLEFNIAFLKELKVRQPIYIESQMVSLEKKIGLMRQDILDEAGETCCRARMTFGIFDLNTRKLMLPPKQWLLAIGLDLE